MQCVTIYVICDSAITGTFSRRTEAVGEASFHCIRAYTATDEECERVLDS